MTKGEYETRINQMGWSQLRSLWSEILDGSTPGWGSGKALEYLVLKMFALQGGSIRWPYSVELGGEEVEQIDGAFFIDGLSFICEAKDWSAKANIEPIAKLRNQLLRRPAGTVGCVFARSGFTEPAVTLANYSAPHPILLWNGDEIDFALRRENPCEILTTKYRFLVEEGLQYNAYLEVLNG